MSKLILILFAFLTLLGCKKMNAIRLYSPDKKQCITIFNSNDVRYIINGEHNKLPDTNYIKLDISKVPELGDYICVCWERIYKWEIVVDKSKIIESKLDTNVFKFSNVLPLNEEGIPTVSKFRQEHCALFDFHSMKLIPNKGAVVEYD